VTDPSPRKLFSPAGIGCFIFVLGSIAGFIGGFIWGNAQVYTSDTGYVYRGDARGMLVMARALGGALLGGVVASVVAFLWRRRGAERNQRGRGEGG
jgi:xanthine/uracil permease